MRGASAGLVVLLLSPALSAQTLDDAQELHASGQLEEAVKAYRTVAAASASDPETAASARNNACVALMDLGDYRSALAECQQALRLRRTLDDEPRLARTLNNNGLVLQYLGRYAEAEQRFREALAINRRAGDAESQVINLANLGLVAISAGRYTRALAFHRQAADLAARHPDEPWSAEQLRVARINQGVVLEKLGAYREALDSYRQVLAESDALDPRLRASLRVNAGVVYRNLGDPVSALEAFREAVRIYEAEGDTAGLSNAWLNTGLAHHLNLARPKAAEEAYREALKHAQQSGDRSEEIQDLFYLGRLLLDLRRLDEAERVFQRCLDLAGQSGSPEGRWSALDGLGRIAAARGQTSRALGLLERAMAEVEKVRSSIPRGSLRFHYFGDKRSIYAAAVELLAGLDRKEPDAGHAERALEIVQRAKVRELLDALGTSRRPAAPLQTADLRKRLGEDVLLEYFLGERNLYRWIVRNDGVRMADLGPAVPVLESVAEVHQALSRSKGPQPGSLDRLSQTLLAAAGPLLEEAAELRIAPDGALHYLPFELLEDPGRPGEPIVARVTTSYLPSGSALAWLGDRDPNDWPAVTFLGFGSPRLPRGPSSPAVQMNLQPLPGATRELESAARQIGGRSTLRIGDQATEDSFRRNVALGARVVHLATHTVLDERPGRGAAVLFTPSNDDDGLLDPEEIAALDYPAALTVLASCRSALPAGTAGSAGGNNALATLTGSFLAAGSPAVVATLWDVDDAATAAFMEQLYYQLGKGEEPAGALRKAKERLRSDPQWNRPELWAGYVVIGKGDAQAGRLRLPAWVWVLTVLLAAGVLFAFLRSQDRSGTIRKRRFPSMR
ncbi:MAG TPA: CHAT domain-containing tetratricopeptide repeat protein [Thermoanaerobaculia bacterium]